MGLHYVATAKFQPVTEGGIRRPRVPGGGKLVPVSALLQTQFCRVVR
jgi:hypothetical protein